MIVLWYGYAPDSSEKLLDLEIYFFLIWQSDQRSSCQMVEKKICKRALETNSWTWHINILKKRTERMKHFLNLFVQSFEVQK
jgi:hypothetical protein